MKTDHAFSSLGNERFMDRRDFMRLDKSGSGLVRRRGERRPVASGRILDISANGLNLLCEATLTASLGPGTPVEIVARLDESSEPFFLLGHVIWRRQQPPEQCQIG
ncbi:MAG TPA: PilZ domain-containing protein, partial [Halothiobacillaceae bacterium]|nr:PilZ domain-containing protein [Halothiobacillaceae bacterium]